jgi:hypothetical protein
VKAERGIRAIGRSSPALHFVSEFVPSSVGAATTQNHTRGSIFKPLIPNDLFSIFVADNYLTKCHNEYWIENRSLLGMGQRLIHRRCADKKNTISHTAEIASTRMNADESRL